MIQAISYYRVSTDRQGKTGLGLSSQRKAVKQFAKQNRYRIIEEYTEIESGKNNKRPVLLNALVSCKKSNSVLLIAKLDRLGRDVEFISKLRKSTVEFVAVDNPHANTLVVHIMAAFAEHEREMISKRTKDALQAAKAKGVQLGRFGKEVLAERNRKRSQDFALKMKGKILRLRRKGFITVRDITEELNRKKVPTYRKGNHKWHLATVHNVLKIINEKNS